MAVTLRWVIGKFLLCDCFSYGWPFCLPNAKNNKVVMRPEVRKLDFLSVIMKNGAWNFLIYFSQILAYFLSYGWAIFVCRFVFGMFEILYQVCGDAFIYKNLENLSLCSVIHEFHGTPKRQALQIINRMHWSILSCMLHVLLYLMSTVRFTSFIGTSMSLASRLKQEETPYHVGASDFL